MMRMLVLSKGADGVRDVLKVLKDELRRAMMLSGEFLIVRGIFYNLLRHFVKRIVEVCIANPDSRSEILKRSTTVAVACPW